MNVRKHVAIQNAMSNQKENGAKWMVERTPT
jgi:hypothetical protein